MVASSAEDFAWTSLGTVIGSIVGIAAIIFLVWYKVYKYRAEFPDADAAVILNAINSGGELGGAPPSPPPLPALPLVGAAKTGAETAVDAVASMVERVVASFRRKRLSSVAPLPQEPEATA
jgi:hypothetical protein